MRGVVKIDEYRLQKFSRFFFSLCEEWLIVVLFSLKFHNKNLFCFWAFWIVSQKAQKIFLCLSFCIGFFFFRSASKSTKYSGKRFLLFLLFFVLFFFLLRIYGLMFEGWWRSCPQISIYLKKLFFLLLHPRDRIPILKSRPKNRETCKSCNVPLSIVSANRCLVSDGETAPVGNVWAANLRREFAFSVWILQWGRTRCFWHSLSLNCAF